MDASRRDFLKTVGSLSAAASTVWLPSLAAGATAAGHEAPGGCGVLVDLSLCIGCRKCEYACRKANGGDAGNPEDYDNDASVFERKRRAESSPAAEQPPCVFDTRRRPGPDDLTVVNAWEPASTASAEDGAPVYAKLNCLHCNYPACVSACIVGALEKQDNGAVTYDASKCIGCRYCMVACPFQIPAYEYDDAFTPEVRKCEFCFDRLCEGELPACVAGCPQEALRFGQRDELLALAHRRIEEHPQRYVDHVYGEFEVGGTAWMYLSPVPFEEVGFLQLDNNAPPALTEAIQHGVFKHGIAPVALYGLFAFLMWHTGRRARLEVKHDTPDPSVAVAVASPTTASAPDPPSKSTMVHAPLSHTAERVHADHGRAMPMRGRLWTPGVIVLMALVGVGLVSATLRFAFGIGPTTNLDQQHPWGLWIAMDVGSGIALAGGGFVTALLVHILHRHHYHAVARSALLTALLGYTFYVPGLLADLGRYYNIWHPILPSMWQVNSVLFEVGICVMVYLNVQYVELAPIICERLMADATPRRVRLARIAGWLHHHLERIMPALLVLGVTLSMFHQSSLGNLMVIAPFKLHVLWWTPISPVLFLLSAIMVGLPMVILTMLLARWSLRQQPEMEVLSPLARYVPPVLAVYLALKVGDVLVRGAWQEMVSVDGALWVTELMLGVVLPLVLLLNGRVRRSAVGLGSACLMIILGVVLNRLNVFMLAYHPPFAEKAYIPSLIEFGLSIGLVAALMLVYRVAVAYLPILEPRPARPEA